MEPKTKKNLGKPKKEMKQKNKSLGKQRKTKKIRGPGFVYRLEESLKIVFLFGFPELVIFCLFLPPPPRPLLLLSDPLFSLNIFSLKYILSDRTTLFKSES